MAAVVMRYVLTTLAAAREALFELPPAAVGMLLLAGVLLVVLTAAVGALVTFDVIDSGAPARHRIRHGCVRVDQLCPRMSYSTGTSGKPGSFHGLQAPGPPGSIPGPAPASCPKG